MYKTFIDLDELVSLCKAESAKQFIQEAVACCRAGAYRSCIVSTWNAIVFDFIHKLKQLEQIGNGDASKLIKDFEEMSKNNDVKRLWEFESNIPKRALSEFELISPIEEVDITRLFDDRSRCAHPSMSSLEEPFEATAELARYHMRSAVTHLLQRPPVQGRSAVKRIWQDIESDYFPTIPHEAAKYFENGPLARARPSLVRDVVVGLTTSLLTENLPDNERDRQFSGLNAVALMYPSEVKKVFDQKLSSIILDKVTDKDWVKVVTYIRKVTAVENLSDPCKLKATTFIQKINIKEGINRQNQEILVNAAHIDFLKNSVKNTLVKAPINDILNLQGMLPDEIDCFLQENLNESIQTFLDEFAKTESYSEAQAYTKKFIGSHIL